MIKRIYTVIALSFTLVACGTMMSQDQFVSENIDYYFISEDYSLQLYSIKDFYADKDINSVKKLFEDSLLPKMILDAHRLSMEYDVKASYRTSVRSDPRQQQYSLVGESVDDTLVETLASLVKSSSERISERKNNNRPTIIRYSSNFRTVYQFDITDVQMGYNNKITRIRIHRAVREYNRYAFVTAFTQVDFDSNGNIINYKNRAFNLTGFLGAREQIDYEFTKK